MINRSVQFLKLLQKYKGIKQVFPQNNFKVNLMKVPQANFSFFKNIFLSSDEKKLNKLRQSLYEVNVNEKVDIMNEIIKQNQTIKQKDDYEYFYYDQFILAEYLKQSGKELESEKIFNSLEKSNKSIPLNELIARKLLLNPMNSKLKGELERIINTAPQINQHSLPFCQMALANYYLVNQDFIKCEQILKTASENIENIINKSKENKTDQYSQDCQIYTKMLIYIKLMEYNYEIKNVEQFNKSQDQAVACYKILEKKQQSLLGYAVNQLNPDFIQIVNLQIKVAEFFQDYSLAIDQYQIIINIYEEINQTNSELMIQLKLNQLNCLIIENEFSDSKMLLKEIKQSIIKYQPENYKLIAQQKMLEIEYQHKKNYKSDLNEQISEASKFCQTHKIYDLTYARILIKYLNINSEKGNEECLPIIKSLEILLKQIKDVPFYAYVDYYISSSNYYLFLKDSQNVSNQFRTCINILKSPPPQKLSCLRLYYIWIGHLYNLQLNEEAKQIYKEAKEYFELSKPEFTASQILSINLLYCEIDEKERYLESQKKK